MKTKSLKKLAGILSRNEGISIIPIIALIVIMSVMGGVFTSIMGNWKMSAPTTLYSHKAFFLAETAAMTAIQDTQYRFYSKKTDGSNWFNFGTSTADPYLVSSVTTGHVIEEADYWFEMPGSNDDVSTGSNDDNVSDDDDDSSDPDRYSIIATGTVTIGGTTMMAKRQIKILADITPSAANTVVPGVQTSGGIQGPALGGFGIDFGGTTVTYTTGPLDTTIDIETGIVIRPAQDFDLLETFDEDFVKAIATDQLHYHTGDHNVTTLISPYPNASFYYDSPTNTMPNFTYVVGNLTVSIGNNANGVIWVKGNVTLDDTLPNEAIIVCEGNIDFDFGTGNTSQINGGIIQLGAGVITGNDKADAIVVNTLYYSALDAIIPDIDVISWNETVSAN